MNKLRHYVKTALLIGLLTTSTTTVVAQTNCEEAIEYTIGNEEKYDFEEGQTEYFISFLANNSELTLNLSPFEEEPITTIDNVKLYAFSDCGDLELKYQRGLTDYFPSDNFIFTELIEENNYLIRLERTESSGLGEKSFNFLINRSYSYPCPEFTSECGEIIKNGEFFYAKTEHTSGNLSHTFFRDTLVCEYENAFGYYAPYYHSGPEDSAYAVLYATKYGNTEQAPGALLQRINVTATKNYSLAYDLKAGFDYLYKINFRSTNQKPDTFHVFLTTQISLDSILDSVTSNNPNRLYDPIRYYQKFIDSLGNKQLVASISSSQMHSTFHPYNFCFNANDDYDVIIFVAISNTGNYKLKFIGLDNISLREFERLDVDPYIGIDNYCHLPITIGPDCVFPNTTYSWSPSTGLSDPNSPNPHSTYGSGLTWFYQKHTLTVSIAGSTCSLSDTVVLHKGNFHDYMTYRNTDYNIPHGSDVDWIKANMTPKSGTSNVFENYEIYLGGLLTVDKLIDGEPLTFKNCSFYADEKGKIVVDNTIAFNNRLILDGTSISTCKTRLWHGIELCSQDTTSQQNMAKSLELINGVEISDAKVGIRTGQTNMQGQFIEGTAGAYFTSVGSTFRNNFIDIKFHPYQNFQAANPSTLIKDKTEIYDTDFISDDQLAKNLFFTQNRIEMEGVDGIKFGGCRFDNQLSFNNYPIRGTAIEAITSSFSVFDYQSTRSSFKGFDQAIYSYTQNPLYSPYIRKCDFVNNVQAISLNGNDYAFIVENTFEVPDLASNLKPLGIYMNYCNAYQIEENEFTTIGSGTAQSAVGILINQSYSTVNELYNNSFEDFEVASLVQGDNKLSNGTGLVLKCNDYDNDDYHIALTSVSSMFGTINPEIAVNQGGNAGISDPAGNTFNDLCSGSATSDIHVDAGGSPFNYYHHSDNITTPVCRTTNRVTNIDGLISYSNKQDACPTNLGSGGSGGNQPGGARQRRVTEIRNRLSGISAGQKSINDSAEYLINEYVRLQLLSDTISIDSIVAMLAKSANANNEVRMLAAMSRRGAEFFNTKSIQGMSKEAKTYVSFQQELKQGSGKIYDIAKQDNTHPYYIWAKSAEKQKNGSNIPAPVNLPNRENQEINKSLKGSQISLYPNPAKNQFYIAISENSTPSDETLRELHVYNIDGKKIKSIDLNSKQNKYQISTENWATGIYLVRLITNGRETESHKISIQ
ncbi:MAG: T9SS C-terminal target domain-containing protein [Bacteroidetes bacterium]|nr:MAG: T9SS C-terminal target domain-containing protein [Bacteroidota bacterium]MBL1143670.1 T9SS C-terminal target domain-containing protein [Bacteroidota bacterium]NOG56472.1 T9SS type A sorting domain-containing protein [Bacteroidota bacterium]